MHSKKRRAVWLLSLIASVGALACATTQDTATPTSESTPNEACFDRTQIDSFSPLHGMYVYVRVLHDGHYLLTLDTIYLTLTDATRMTIVSNFNRVCSYSQATLNFVDAGHPVSARVIRVEAVASKDEAEKLVETRTGKS